MRVRLLNVAYSANLGDGLLAECLSARLRAARPELEIEWVDLSGRTRFGTVGGGGRGLLLKMLTASPGPVRRAGVLMAHAYLRRKTLAPHFGTALAGAEALIIGPGALIADQDLNFPVKIAAALASPAAADAPVHVYGVGVGGAFSPRGEALFRHAFSARRVASVAVRDSVSAERWNKGLGGAAGCPAQVVFDPGVLTSRVWPEPEAGRGPLRIGVMSPSEIAYHAGGSATAPGAALEWYGVLVERLRAAGCEVELFNNGGPPDRAFMRRLSDFIADRGAERPACIQPETPEDLARVVAGSRGVIAHRLHAVVPAFSYGVPAVSLGWDGKVAAFAEAVGRSRWHAAGFSAPPENMARLLLEAVEAKACGDDRSGVLDAADAQIAALAARL